MPPTVQRFAAQFSKDLHRLAESISGRDGRLTRKELKDGLWGDWAPRDLSDNLRNYFEKGHARGLMSVPLEKLKADAFRYAERAATSAAGGDGILSAKEATRLPKDLRADYGRVARYFALQPALQDLMGGKDSGRVRKISERDFDSGKVPRAAAEALWNRAIDEDGTQEYHFVLGRDRKTVVGYAVTTRYFQPGGGFPSVQVEIVDRRGKLIAEDSKA